MPDTSMLYPNTPAMLQPSPATSPASGGGALKTGPGAAAPSAPVLGNGPNNSAAAANAVHSPNLWGAPSTPTFLSPSTLAFMGVDTSQAPPGTLFNTQTQQWEVPPADWAAMGGERVDSFSGGRADYSNPGETPGAAAPLAPSAHAENLMAPLHRYLNHVMGTGGTPAALKSGGAGTTPASTMPTALPPGGNGAYGTFGNLQSRTGASQPDLTGLPPWLASQYQNTQSVDEGGSSSNYWNLNENPWGGFKGEDGQSYVQVGDPSSWKGGGADGGIKDPSKVTYDPNLGYITTADNLHDSGIGGPDWRMIAAVLGAGVGGTALGLGETGAGGAAAGAGVGAGAGAEGLTTLNTGLSSIFAGPPELAPALTGTGAAVAGGAAAGAGGGAATGTGVGSGVGSAVGTGAAGAGVGSAISNILGGPLGRILAPVIIGSVLKPNTNGGGHTGGGGGTGGGGTGTGTGSNVNIGSGPDDALRAQLQADLGLGDQARATLLNHGKPSDAQTTAINSGIEQQRQQGREAILQASINSGQGGADSMVVQDKLRAFDGQLEVQRQELMQKQAESNTSTALQEMGYISREMQAYAELQFRESEDIAQLYSNLFDSLGRMFGAQPGSGRSGGGGGTGGSGSSAGSGSGDDQTPISITDENGFPVDPNSLDVVFDP